MAKPRVNYSPETCGFCGGSGKDNDPPTGAVKILRCEVCNGQGSVLVAQPSRQCSFCGGSGKDKNPPPGVVKILKCEVCGGTGWAHTIVSETGHEDWPDDVLEPPLDVRANPFRGLD